MNIMRFPLENSFAIHITNLLNDTEFNRISTFCNILLKKTNFTTSDDNDEAVNKAIQPILKKLKDVLNDNFNCNVINTGYQLTKNRQENDDWHIHKPQFLNEDKIFPVADCYVAVVYLHKVWDDKFGGKLILGHDRNNPLLKISSAPNSCIIHNQKLHHGVEWMSALNQFNLSRLSLFSHWYKDIK